MASSYYMIISRVRKYWSVQCIQWGYWTESVQFQFSALLDRRVLKSVKFWRTDWNQCKFEQMRMALMRASTNTNQWHFVKIDSYHWGDAWFWRSVRRISAFQSVPPTDWKTLCFTCVFFQRDSVPTRMEASIFQCTESVQCKFDAISLQFQFLNIALNWTGAVQCAQFGPRTDSCTESVQFDVECLFNILGPWL